MMENKGKDRRVDAHIPAKFFAGRGRALKELANKPLKAEEVEKRRRLQELILHGSVSQDKLGKVPGGLSQGKWAKGPHQSAGSQFNRRPDPIWTSYRSDECSINSYGSDSSVGTSSLSNSTGVPTTPKPDTPMQSDTPSMLNKLQIDGASNGTGVWDKPQSGGTSAWNEPQTDGTSAWNKPQTDSTSAWNKPQTDSTSAWNKPQTDGTGVWDKPQSGGTSAWNKPQTDSTSAWNKPQIDGTSVWDKPQIDGPQGAQNEKYSPLNNSFDFPNQRAFKQELPPRFRNRPPKQKQRKVNQYGFGANQKHKSANNKDLRKPTWSPASMQNQDNFQELAKKAEGNSAVSHVADTSPWSDWEKSVVIHGSLSKEDLEQLAVIEDNDDIHDVFVNQYLNAMQEEEMNQKPKEVLQLTPSKVQQMSKLKSTIQADSAKPPPGTIPEPPKKLDRWGGTELQNNGAVGWGDTDDDGGNWYEDGVSAWGTPKSTPGWT